MFVIVVIRLFWLYNQIFFLEFFSFLQKILISKKNVNAQ